MTSNIISRAACLAELTSNPKSFFNCSDLHGGCDSPRSYAPARFPQTESPASLDRFARRGDLAASRRKVRSLRTVAATTNLLNGSMNEHVQIPEPHTMKNKKCPYHAF